MAFPIGKSSHKMWSDFRETTAFVRRIVEPREGDPPEGIVGGAIVMSYPEDQYDYLAYIAIHPDYRYHHRLFRRSSDPHHGTELLHHVYDEMRSRVGVARLQRRLIIEPAGDAALRFYLRAMPTNEYPLKFYEADRVISVSYDGLAL
jgi:ribosomal protein S18 acetylase RimI-like enzyme